MKDNHFEGWVSSSLSGKTSQASDKFKDIIRTIAGFEPFRGKFESMQYKQRYSPFVQWLARQDQKYFLKCLDDLKIR
jgi:hypothetical protein